MSATSAGGALAQAFDFKPNQRYPDPAVLIVDPSFAKYRIYSSTVEQVATGMREHSVTRRLTRTEKDGKITAVPVLRRAQEQPSLHGELPFAIRVLC